MESDMTIHATIQDLTGATCDNIPAGQYHGGFDAVRVAAKHSQATIFLPTGTGQAVADAINAALLPAPEGV